MRKKKKAIPQRARNNTKAPAGKPPKRKTKKKRAVSNRKPAAPKTRGANTLTESEYFSRIRSSLRRAFRWWPPMMLALKKGSRPSQHPNKRIKIEYLCNHCGQWKTRREIEIDHIVECGSLNNYDDIVPFIQRLTAENINSFQLLCKPCHKEKTSAYLLTKKIKKNSQ
jgi:5-methylcytosine-specific restriction endonuclease McrA